VRETGRRELERSGETPCNPARSVSRGRLCLRVGADEAGPGRCSRTAAPSRDRTTDRNGTGTRQRHGADDRTADDLETGRTRHGEGRRRAGPPWCSIHRFDTTKPGAKAGDRRRAQASRCGERTSFGRHRRRERTVRTTRDLGRPGDSSKAGGCETTGRPSATSGMRAGMRPRKLRTSSLVHQATGFDQGAGSDSRA